MASMLRTDLSITDVALDDLPALQALMGAAFDPAFGEAWSPAQCIGILSLPGYRVRIARHADIAAGFSVLRIVAQESELLLLGVQPDLRRAGVGAALLDDWIAAARGAGVVALYLEMRADNPARTLYEAFDFTVAGRRPDYYRGGDGQRRDALTMRRSLMV
jgi:[ribosomal protein S18]-alanine N-acetyltransferase